MSQKSNGLHARRTRKLLREALIALIEERGFDAITVGEIAERAMVSRAAFYRYYQDKYDLVEQIFEEAIQTLISDLGPPPHDFPGNFDLERMPESWVKFFEHFAEYERFYRVLLGGKGSSWFVTKMRAYLTETMGQRVQRSASSPGAKLIADHGEFVAALVAALIVDAITLWLEQGRPYTPRQIATHCYHLIFALLRDVSTWE